MRHVTGDGLERGLERDRDHPEQRAGADCFSDRCSAGGREADASGRSSRRPHVLGDHPRVDGRRGPVRAALRALEVKGFVVASPKSLLAGQPEYAFSHALKREVAYRSIPRARRARAHAAVAGLDRGGRRGPPRGVRGPDRLSPRGRGGPGGRCPGVAGRSAERERVRAAAVRALLAAGEAAEIARRPRRRAADSLIAPARCRAPTPNALAASNCVPPCCTPRFAATRRSPPTSRRWTSRARLQKAAVSRLRAHAALLCARYSGAFSDSAWRGRAVELVKHGLERSASEACRSRPERCSSGAR